MAIYYLKSTTGSNVNGGSTWAAAFATLSYALSQMAVGDTVYVSQSHAETQGSAMTLTSLGTAASPCYIVCANDGANPPTVLATSATVTVTGAFGITFAGMAYVYGITLNCGTGSTGGNLGFTSVSSWWWRFDTCALKIVGTNVSNKISVGGATSRAMLLELINTTVSFGAAGQTIVLGGGDMRWQYTPSAVSGVLPTALFTGLAGAGSELQLYGVDLSNLGSTKNLFSVGFAQSSNCYLENCKLGTSVAFETGAIDSQGGYYLEVVNCDNTTTNYNYYKQVYQGTTQSAIDVVRTGGATDGTTPISRKMVSSANSHFYSPLESAPIRFWNNSLAGVTLTVYIANNSSYTTTNQDVWMEVEELGTLSGYPLSVLQTSRADDNFVTASSPNTTDTVSAWGTAPTTLQTLTKSFTPTKVGPCSVRVMVAKPTFTMWFDPNVVSSSARGFMTGRSYLNEEVAVAVVVLLVEL